MRIEYTIVEKAYKKLKSSVYFDKTQLILRNAIVEFEETHSDIDEYLYSLFVKLNDSVKFRKLQNEYLIPYLFHVFQRYYIRKTEALFQTCHKKRLQ